MLVREDARIRAYMEPSGDCAVVVGLPVIVAGGVAWVLLSESHALVRVESLIEYGAEASAVRLANHGGWAGSTLE